MMPISIAVSMLSILLITYLLSVQGVQMPLIVYAGPFTTWFVFFMLGVYYSSEKINYTVKQAIAVIIFGLVLECVETYWLNTNYGGGYGIKLSAFIYSVGVIMLILSPKVKVAYKSNKLTSIIAYIGNISFGVYLTHCFVIKGVNYLCSPYHSWILSWLLVVIITSIIVVIARKILPHKLNKYFDVLRSQAEEKGLADDVKFYLEFFKYGCPPHGGFGLGIDRLTMLFLGLSIKEVQFLFRGPNRLTP